MFVYLTVLACSSDVHLLLPLLSSFYIAQYFGASSGLRKCLQIPMPYTRGRLCSETFENKDDDCSIQVSAFIRRKLSSLYEISILQVCLFRYLPVSYCSTTRSIECAPHSVSLHKRPPTQYGYRRTPYHIDIGRKLEVGTPTVDAHGSVTCIQ